MILPRRLGRIVTLSPVLRCPFPKCERIPVGVRGDLLTIACRHCGARWWATRLATGNVRAQLRAEFAGDDAIVRFLDLNSVPFTIPEPMFLQVMLTKHEQHHFLIEDRGHSLRQRSQLLFQAIAPGRA